MLRGLFSRITQVFTGARLDDDLYDDLEQALIEGDVGVGTATKLVEGLREAVRRREIGGGEEATVWLRGEVAKLLAPAEGDGSLHLSSSAPALILVVGVNGAGKTTSIAKLCHWLQSQGKTTLLAAADTFRAAAVEQLQIWGDRLGAEVIRHQQGSDPAAVVFDAVQAARARGTDVVIVDTAGRLHTQSNLMEELKKIHRVAERALERPPDEVLIVLDATTGQNAVEQVRRFQEAMPLTGILLAKMDGTARGGVIVTVRDEFDLPIKFVGTGEQATDLAPFDAAVFVEELFAPVSTDSPEK